MKLLTQIHSHRYVNPQATTQHKAMDTEKQANHPETDTEYSPTVHLQLLTSGGIPTRVRWQ